MFKSFHALAHIHDYAEFLMQFSLEAFGKGFAGLAFAAGKFPQASLMTAGRALGDQEFAITKQQPCGDHHRFVHGQRQ